MIYIPLIIGVLALIVNGAIIFCVVRDTKVSKPVEPVAPILFNNSLRSI